MNGETFLILGGGGMIGAQVVREIARHLQPRSVIICSRELSEVEETIDNCRGEFPLVEFIGFGGDVFGRADWNVGPEESRPTRSQLMSSIDSRAACTTTSFTTLNPLISALNSLN